MRTARSLASLRAGRTDWYRIENNAKALSADVYIYDEIGFWGVSAQDFVAAFRGEIDASADVTVHINSPGGSVFDGITILNALRAHKGGVTTVVDGLAASAASFIAQAGTKRIMARNSQMMIHDAMSLCVGNASDMREVADLLDKASDNLADVYAHRSGRGDVKSWRAEMEKEVWYSAQEAVDAGLADEVDGVASKQDEDKLAASWDLSIYAHASRTEAPAPEPLPVIEPELPVTAAPAWDKASFLEGLHNGA